MGDFAVSVARGYQVGAARGNYSVLSAMEIRDDELFAAFGRSINDLILAHREDLETKRAESVMALRIGKRWIEATSRVSGPKARWVDGTPEYSLHIYGLRKLFPDALFVHLFRDVGAVVRSMINFHRTTGIHLVVDEEDAYKYWLRTVRACLKAEEAYGPRVIYRLRYAHLIDQPESAIRSLLDFVGEPYDAQCLEPLSQRINSSDVPSDFKFDDSAVDPAIVEDARRLSAEVDEAPQPVERSAAAADELQADFSSRVKFR
jgi:sulfotransferase family protein